MTRWGIGALALAMTLGGGVAWAGGETSRLGYGQGSMRKLGRGVANVVTAPLEMIRTPSLVNEQEGWIAGLTVGITQGLSATAVRGIAGVLEVATFLIPIPKNFKPLVTPEFVFQNGKWTS